MKEAKKNQVNRCFGNSPRFPRKGKKPELPPSAEKNKDEEVKRVLQERAEKRKADKEISCLLKQFRGRYSLLDLLELIKRRSPRLFNFAIAKVESQKRRNNLSLNEIVRFEKFKMALTETEAKND